MLGCDATSLVEMLADDYDLEPADAITIAAELANARFTQQQALTVETPPLREALIELERRGIVARENFTCCGTCLAAEISGEIPAEGTWYGYVAYHSQDTERLVESGQTYLSHGVFVEAYLSRTEFDAMPKKERDAWYARKTADLINNQILPVLQSRGIEAQWSGRVGERIKIAGASFYYDLSEEELAEFDGDELEPYWLPVDEILEAGEDEPPTAIGPSATVAYRRDVDVESLLLRVEPDPIMFLRPLDPDDPEVQELGYVVLTSYQGELFHGAVKEWSLVDEHTVRLVLDESGPDGSDLEVEMHFDDTTEAASVHGALLRMLQATGEATADGEIIFED